MTSSLSWPSKWIDLFSGLHIRPFDLRTHDFVYEGAKEGHHGCFTFMDDRMKVQFVSRKGNTTAFHRLQIDLISQWVKVQHKYRKAWQSFLCTRRSTNKEKVVGLHCIGPYSVPRWEIPVGWKHPSVSAEKAHMVGSCIKVSSQSASLPSKAMTMTDFPYPLQNPLQNGWAWGP